MPKPEMVPASGECTFETQAQRDLNALGGAGWDVRWFLQREAVQDMMRGEQLSVREVFTQDIPPVRTELGTFAGNASWWINENGDRIITGVRGRIQGKGDSVHSARQALHNSGDTKRAQDHAQQGGGWTRIPGRQR